MSSHVTRSRGGFTLIELLVVIAIIALLAGITFPVFSKAREKGRQTQCTSNQRQIAIAVQMYSNDWEKFPGTNWYGALDGLNKVLVCPTASDLDVGYGMNGYLHRARPDAISRASDVIVTTDSNCTSCVSAQFGRHTKGAVFSRLDGSAKLAFTPGQAGRFAVGRFPIVPIVVADGTERVEMPEHFAMKTAGEEVTKEFCVIGPYGDEAAVAGVEGTQVAHDYIAESALSTANADESPIPGDAAPSQENLSAPGTESTTSPGDVKVLKTWTVPTNDKGVYSFEQMLHSKYEARTIYAVTYIYSETEQTANISWWCDDGGIIWLNGKQIARSAYANAGNSPVNPSDPAAGGKVFIANPILIPQGISYMLVKLSNSEQGGMKFKISFDKPLGFGSAL